MFDPTKIIDRRLEPEDKIFEEAVPHESGHVIWRMNAVYPFVILQLELGYEMGRSRAIFSTHPRLKCEIFRKAPEGLIARCALEELRERSSQPAK